jgi:glyoxylase-like metal-dependent hydrolase (beta-lactamase superfamily II)
MCDLTRRNLLLASGAVAGLAPAGVQGKPIQSPAADMVNQVDPVAAGVYFHQGDLEHGVPCNNGWVVFKDYILVIDANYPSGAQIILPKIRALTSKPIRFAFDTHHHGDHSYGNALLNEQGATPVAHTGVIEEMKRCETGYYGGKPGRWEDAAKERPDVAASRLLPPSVLFPHEVYFDDGEHRVELLHLGVAHTHGDAMAWLPKERILFTGDACVNGPYNFLGDGDVEKWIGTLDVARKLGAKIVCPGHGPRGVESVLADQQFFFQQLRERVGVLLQARKSAREIYQSVGQIRGELLSQPRIARYVGEMFFAAQVEKVYTEMTGEAFPADAKASNSARLLHARDHDLQLV